MLPTKPLRTGFNALSTSDTEEGEIPTNQEVCMRGDIDISYLHQMMAPERVKLSMKRGIFFERLVHKI